MLKKKYNIRKIIIVLMFLVTFTLYGGRLINMQVANAESYRNKIEKTTVREYTVPAFRGEVFDRNGEPLITNRPVYNLTIFGKYLNKKTLYDTVSELIKLVEDNGCIVKADSLPINEIKNSDGSYGYVYSTALTVNENARNSFNRYLKNRELDLEITAEQLMEYIVQTFKLSECPPENLRRIAGIFYDFDRFDVLGGSAEHILSQDVNIFIMTYIKEHSADFTGVEIIPSYERVYNHPGVASHILGRIGKIGDYSEYEDKGYEMNAIVGVSGVEKAFEEYLRGKDGVIKKTYDEQGNLIKEEYEKPEDEPITGKNVYLTIDYKLQEFIEKDIPMNIEKIHALAEKDKNPAIAGIDASAGSAVVMNPNNGEIWAIATYPSYDNSNFDATELLLDPANPLFNRAASGQYPPGSTFKISTALAGLCEGIINPDTKIEDKGIWTKFGTGAGAYQPRCWKYLYRPGANHGWINVIEAIRESCNYFFFELGERLTIETMNKYSRALGYGEYTGIETGETKGKLASPALREARNEVWVPGDVIQAAIGQSLNTFSPLQMATALSTVLNGGTRFSSHLLKSVNEFHTNNVVFYKETEILSQIEISDTTKSTLKQAMNDVLEATGGTASNLFNNFPIKVGGKTGTAQIVNGSSDLATFVSFAPFDEPEIVVSVVIEFGAKGTYAGFVAKDIMEYYFGFRTEEEILGIEQDDIM